MRDRDPSDVVGGWLGTFGEQYDVSDSSVDTAMCPVLAWAASGAMALTGRANGPPVASPAAILGLASEVARVLAWASGRTGARIHPDPALTLTGRAGSMELSRRGQISAGGASRLLRAQDGWCAVTLSRQEDLDLVPAILGRTTVADPWEELTAAACAVESEQLAARVQQFGVPAAALARDMPVIGAPWRVSPITTAACGLTLDGALVADLSSLWAGPLCGHLLAGAGATVVKVESTGRPDGARYGNQRFYDWMHAGQQSLAVDFSTTAGRVALAELVRAADIVIEASRPRALRHLGLAPEDIEHRPGKVWISITGYGRASPTLVGFGDDAAVAGGLVGWSDGEPVFCADAVADPLTGLTAALAAAVSIARGGGHLIDLSLRDVAAAFAAAPAVDHGPHAVRHSGAGWIVECPKAGGSQQVLPPRAPDPIGSAPTIGADNDRVLRSLLGNPCGDLGA